MNKKWCRKKDKNQTMVDNSDENDLFKKMIMLEEKRTLTSFSNNSASKKIILEGKNTEYINNEASTAGKNTPDIEKILKILEDKRMTFSREEKKEQHNFNPITIAYMARWGTGKTSKMLKIKEEVKDSYNFVTLNLWRFSKQSKNGNSNDFTRAMVNDIYSKIASNEEAFQKVSHNKTTTKEYAISASIFANFFKMAGGKVSAEMKKGTKTTQRELKYVDEYMLFLTSIIDVLSDETKKPTIIVLDDLDRVDVKDVKNILDSIISFLFIKNVIYIFPIDEKHVLEGIKIADPGKDPYNSLNKYFNYSIRSGYTPIMNKKKIITTILEEIPENKRPNEKSIRMIVAATDSSYRSMKDLINIFLTNKAILLSHSNNLDDSHIVFGSSLQFLAPKLLDHISSNPSNLNELNKLIAMKTLFKKLAENTNLTGGQIAALDREKPSNDFLDKLFWKDITSIKDLTLVQKKDVDSIEKWEITNINRIILLLEILDISKILDNTKTKIDFWQAVSLAKIEGEVFRKYLENSDAIMYIKDSIKVDKMNKKTEIFKMTPVNNVSSRKQNATKIMGMQLRMFFQNIGLYVEDGLISEAETNTIANSLFFGRIKIHSFKITPQNKKVIKKMLMNASYFSDIPWEEKTTIENLVKIGIGTTKKSDVTLMDSLLSNVTLKQKNSELLTNVFENIDPFVFDAKETMENKYIIENYKWIEMNPGFFASPLVTSIELVDVNTVVEISEIIEPLFNKFEAVTLVDMEKGTFDIENVSISNITNTNLMTILLKNKSLQNLVLIEYAKMHLEFESFSQNKTEVGNYLEGLDSFSQSDIKQLLKNKNVMTKIQYERIVEIDSFNAFLNFSDKLLEHDIVIGREKAIREEDEGEIETDAQKQYAISTWGEIDGNEFEDYIFPYEEYDTETIMNIKYDISNTEEILELLTEKEASEIFENISNLEQGRFSDLILTLSSQEKYRYWKLAWEDFMEQFDELKVEEIEGTVVPKEYEGIFRTNFKKLIDEIVENKDIVEQNGGDLADILEMKYEVLKEEVDFIKDQINELTAKIKVYIDFEPVSETIVGLKKELNKYIKKQSELMVIYKNISGEDTLTTNILAMDTEIDEARNAFNLKETEIRERADTLVADLTLEFSTFNDLSKNDEIVSNALEIETEANNLSLELSSNIDETKKSVDNFKKKQLREETKRKEVEEKRKKDAAELAIKEAKNNSKENK